jgi:uncharacterized protein (TIGR02147 family)
MKIKLQDEEFENLLKCKNYRDFLAEMILVQEKAGRSLGYAKLARLLGVKARSYPRDIILGKKRITPALLPQFIKIFGLTGDLRSFLIDLIEMEEPSCRISGRSEMQIQNSLEKLKARLAAGNAKSISLEEAFVFSSLPKIYAALGTPQAGASLSQIKDRTGLEAEQIFPVLEKMKELGIVQKNAQRYFPVQTHIASTGMKKSQIFKHHFMKVAEEAARNARTEMSRDDKLFFSSAFSVKAEQLPQLKTELRDVLLKYIDTSENSNGDKVVSLLCALH